MSAAHGDTQGHRPTRRIVLFDVDGTLTPARQGVQPDMLTELRRLRDTTGSHIGFVGGSDMNKIREQLEVPGGPKMEDLFDYGFAENGLTAWAAPPRHVLSAAAVAVPDVDALGAGPAQPVRSTPASGSSSAPARPTTQFASVSFISWLGEERYKQLVKFVLRYISELDLPVMRGTFVEFRKGMVNISPIGRNASVQERHDFEAYDKVHQIRLQFVRALKARFPDYGLCFSIGGQISFDVFPDGWDKRYALRRLEEEFAQIRKLEKKDQDTVEQVAQVKEEAQALAAATAAAPRWDWDEIHFFGDKTYAGGNDHEIFEDERTQGHTVTCPDDTITLLQELFPSVP